MLDSDDLDFLALACAPRTLAGAIVFVVAIVVIGWIVWSNTDECEAKQCPSGTVGKLLDHECLCVTRPKEP